MGSKDEIKNKISELINELNYIKNNIWVVEDEFIDYLNRKEKVNVLGHEYGAGDILSKVNKGVFGLFLVDYVNNIVIPSYKKKIRQLEKKIEGG